MSHPIRRDSNPTRACARLRPPSSSARGRGMHAPRSRAVESAAPASIVVLRPAVSASSVPFSVTSSSSEEEFELETRLFKGEDDYEEDSDDESYRDMPPLMSARRETPPVGGAKTTRARGTVQRRPSDSQLLRRRSTRSAARTARFAISSELASSVDNEDPPELPVDFSRRVASSTAPALASRKPPPPLAAQRKREPDSSSSSRKRAAAAAAAAGQSPAAAAVSSPAQPSAKRARTDLKPPPNAKNDADYEDHDPTDSAATGVAVEVSCCICMSEPERHEESTINGCEHRFCFGCIAKWSERENSCPLCKVRFTKICRVNPQRTSRGGKGGGQRSVNTKTVKQRDQRSDILSGPTLEGLLHSLAASAAGNPPHNMLDPFMRRLFTSGLMTAGSANSTRAFSLAEFMVDSDDDDDDDDDTEVFHPFSFLMRASTSHYRVGTFVPSFPTAASRAASSSAAAASSIATAAASSSAAAASTESARSFSGRMPTRASQHRSSSSATTTTSGPRFFAVAAAAAATARPARSYATNSSDSRAGHDLANPLEIDDSSDDEIQVIGVNYPTSSAPDFI